MTSQEAPTGTTSINREHRLLRKINKQLALAEARSEAAGRTPTGHGLITGDFRQAGSCLADDSVDLIFTDPPYGKDVSELYGDLYGDLAEFAGRVLRPGGICVAYIGLAFLPDLLAGMCEHLSYMWTFAIRHVGGEPRFRKYNLRNGWKPLMAFLKPPLECWWEPFGDVTSGGREKGDHDWQQAEGEAAHFIEALCPAGGLVVDPMCGSGTALAAAAKLGRKYQGFELDPGVAAKARERLASEGD